MDNYINGRIFPASLSRCMQFRELCTRLRGFTLIEAMVAAAISAIFLSSLFTMNLSSMETSDRPRNRLPPARPPATDGIDAHRQLASGYRRGLDPRQPFEYRRGLRRTTEEPCRNGHPRCPTEAPVSATLSSTALRYVTIVNRELLICSRRTP